RMMALDVLDDDDGVVRDESQCRRDAGQRHEIDGLSRDPEREAHQRHRDGNRGHRDQRESHVAQEEQQHERREYHANDDRVPGTIDRVGHELCLVVEVAPVHIRGQQLRMLPEELPDAVGDGHRIRRGLAHDVHEYGRAPVGRGADVRDRVRHGDLAELRQRDRGTPRHRHRDLPQRIDALHAPGDERQIELVILLRKTGGDDIVVGLYRLHDVRDGQLTAGERGAIHTHLEFALASSLDLHLRHARYANERGFERILRQIPELRLRLRARGQRVALDGKRRGVHPLDVDPRLRWQVGPHALRFGLYPVERGLHIRSPPELGGHFGGAARRDRADRLDAGYAQDRFLEDARDGGHHLRRRLIAHVRDDLHDGERDGGEDGRRKPARLVHAAGNENGEQQYDAGDPLSRAADKPHGAAPARPAESADAPAWPESVTTRTRLPSGSPTWPERMTRSPAVIGGDVISTLSPRCRPVVTVIQCATSLLEITAMRVMPETSSRKSAARGTMVTLLA